MYPYKQYLSQVESHLHMSDGTRVRDEGEREKNQRTHKKGEGRNACMKDNPFENSSMAIMGFLFRRGVARRGSYVLSRKQAGLGEV